MKQPLLFCLFLIAFLNKRQAQVSEPVAIADPPFRNSAFFEVGGNVGYNVSVNYERLFPQVSNQNRTYAIRVGFSHQGFIYRFYKDYKYYQIFPLEASVFWGRKFLKPEVGIGVNVNHDFNRNSGKSFYKNPDAAFYPVGRFGLRFQNNKSHFFGKAGIAAFMVSTGEEWPLPFFPMPGFSVGYQFGRKQN